MKAKYKIIERTHTYSYACDPNFIVYVTESRSYYEIKAPNGKILKKSFDYEDQAKKYIRTLKRK